MGRRKENLISVKVGDTTRMRLPQEKKWSLGQCTRHLGSSLDEVQVDGQRLCRDRLQLLSTLEPSPVSTSNNKEPHQAENDSSLPVLSGSVQTIAKPHVPLWFKRMTQILLARSERENLKNSGLLGDLNSDLNFLDLLSRYCLSSTKKSARNIHIHFNRQL